MIIFIIFLLITFISLVYQEQISIFIFFIQSKKVYFLTILFLFSILYGYCMKKNIYRNDFLDYIYIEFVNNKGSYSNTIKTKRSVSNLTKKIIASNQKWKCKNCNITLDHTYEIDHRIPLYKGGTNNINNLEALCRNCHGLKTINDKLFK